ncbi:aKG-HExxH-type peptide beta-hydroxylase [Allonocardiopsis opalescens]|uniref:HEXXH motif-containing protein n=1 Tax=Allonocardiopsis opalescens TaxID=1144618 RepID=A0A2T0Q206_9ACTN|nr:HEXXH motif-containing putative peptide modification protein [Allonocardiopsis opalescens]PRX97827.1 HEXXH motif-containing protein [Allonocardiopsis opalescens]
MNGLPGPARPVTLVRNDLLALGRGVPARRTLRVLRTGALSRQLAMLELLRRGAADPEAAAAWRAVADAQEREPVRLAQLLASARTGAWAADTIAALRAGGDRVDLSHLHDLGRGREHGTVLRLAAAGLRWEPALDPGEPLRRHLGAHHRPDDGEPSRWERPLAAAWRLLAARHRDAARTLAGLPIVLVPVAAPAHGPEPTATSSWAFGAVALSPPDPDRPAAAALALVRAVQHVLLGAAEDVTALVSPGAPPAPAADALRHGYADAAVAGFWRIERLYGPPDQRAAAADAFARHRASAAAALSAALSGDALTPAGRLVAETARARIAPWLAEAPGPPGPRASGRCDAQAR